MPWLAPHDAQAQLRTQELLQGEKWAEEYTLGRCCQALEKHLANPQCVQTQPPLEELILQCRR